MATATTSSPPAAASVKEAPAGVVPTPAKKPLPEKTNPRQYDLAPLLGIVVNQNAHAHNGFFGSSHRRIEVVFTGVQRDAKQPNLYHLQGKDRYKGVITPFTGTLIINRLVKQPEYSKKEIYEERMESGTSDWMLSANKEVMYTSAGRFILREDSTQDNAGVFQGQVALDWSLNDEGTPVLNSRTSRSLTQGGGTKFEGTWTEYRKAGARPLPVVWVENIESYANYVLGDFQIGDRQAELNPKYAKLGWDNYWENDEWWADSPKPGVSI